MKINEFSSNCKFLITSEYLVIKGAPALAVPLKYKQNLIIEEISKPYSIFETYQNGIKIFEGIFFNDDNSQSDKSWKYINQLLNQIKMLKPSLFLNKSYYFKADLDFDINWGLGSSSSLISNLAYWADLDLFEFFSKVSKGSGYDVFAARQKEPFLYQLNNKSPIIVPVNLNNDIFQNLVFIYLGKKQDSQIAVNDFINKENNLENQILKINRITDEFIKASSINQLIDLIEEHELVISQVLNLPTVKSICFNDFEGSIKSLGAWGGDFIMAISNNGIDYTKNYFSNKGYNTIFSYLEIIKQ